MQLHAVVGDAHSANQRLTNASESRDDAGRAAFTRLVKARQDLRRGETVPSSKGSGKHFMMLLSGMTCVTTRSVDGARQIHTINHPGDFIALHNLGHPEATEHIEVEALSSSSIGTIDRYALERAVEHDPVLGQALWRAAVVEASILRRRLLMTGWPAQQRVAHLMCEQLARLGGTTSLVALSQVEIADAVGLSVVHTNRICQDLRELGVLSGNRSIEVVDGKRLRQLAAFDGRYLDPRPTFGYLRIET